MSNFEVAPTADGRLRIGVSDDYEVLLAPTELPEDQLDLKSITGRGFRVIETAQKVNVHGQSMAIRLFTTADLVTVQEERVQAGGVLLRTQNCGGFEIIIGIEKYTVVLLDGRFAEWSATEEDQRVFRRLLDARWQKVSRTEFSFQGETWRAVLLQFPRGESAVGNDDVFEGLLKGAAWFSIRALAPEVNGLQVWQIENPQQYGGPLHHGAVFQIDTNSILVAVSDNESAHTDLELLHHLEQRGWKRVTRRDRHEEIAGRSRVYLLERGGGRFDDKALQVFDLYHPFDLIGQIVVVRGVGALIFLVPCQKIEMINTIAGAVEGETGHPCRVEGPASVMIEGNRSTECYRILPESAGDTELGPGILMVFQRPTESAAA